MKKGNHNLGEIEIIDTSLVFQNQFMKVFNDEVIFPSGYRGTYLRLEAPTPNSVAVLPIAKDGRFGLLKNYRHGARGWCLEMIKGGAESGESLEAACQREMKEEGGLIALQLTNLGAYSDSPSVFSGLIHCFLAECISAVDRHPESTEAISSIHYYYPEEYFAASRKMDFVDGMTELMVYKYMILKEKERL